MKWTRLIALCALLAAPVFSAWGVDAIVLKNSQDTYPYIEYAWTSDASGAATGQTDFPMTAELLEAITVPDGTNVPTTLYDITVNAMPGVAGTYTALSTDLTNSLILNRSATVTERVAFWPTYAYAFGGSKLQVNITNAGNVKSGTLKLFFTRNLLARQDQLLRLQTTASTNDVPYWNGSAWAVGPVSGVGSGDVSGPASATANAIVLFNGTGGKTIKDSTFTIGTNVGTWIGTPSSANLIAALTDETGTGAAVFATSPTLVTPLLGTPTSGTLTNCTGFPVAQLANLGTGVATALTTPSSANWLAAISDETGTGLLVFATSPTLTTPLLGTPTSGVLTNCTGYTVGNISGLGSNVGTWLATPSSANLAAALTDETGSGLAVFATSPTFTTPLLGVPTSGTLTNCTGYPVANLANLGTGVATWLATPSSANLISALTDETGTGAAVFANTPTLVTPNIGAATGTSVNVTGTLTGSTAVVGGTGSFTTLATTGNITITKGAASRATISAASAGLDLTSTYDSAIGASSIRLDPLVVDNTNPSQINLFRSTNTAGTRLINIFQGDGTGTQNITINAATGLIDTQGAYQAGSSNITLTDSTGNLLNAAVKGTPATTSIVGSDGTNVAWKVPKTGPIILPAGAAIVPTTNPAGTPTQAETSTNKVNYYYAAFADTTNNANLQFQTVLPDNYNGGTVTYTVEWNPPTGSGTVIWGLQAIALGDNVAMDTAFGTAVEVTDTIQTTTRNHITAASGVLTIGGSPAAGQTCFWKLYRNVSDTCTATDTQFISCKVEYTPLPY